MSDVAREAWRHVHSVQIDATLDEMPVLPDPKDVRRAGDEVAKLRPKDDEDRQAIEDAAETLAMMESVARL